MPAKRWHMCYVSLSGTLGLPHPPSLPSPPSRPARALGPVMVYLLFYYAVNWGAKMGCFVLPQEVYTSEFSGTFSGIAAAFGKFGAIVGIWTFEGLTPVIGLIPVMLIVAALATISGFISQNCISDRLWEVQKQQMKAAREGAIAASISSNAANEIASPLHPGGGLDEEEPVAIN
mmetsp:Transcript_93789/g.268465  ORF Transcript_93789/g.268465 Transcript_93789/m.268465 type:complete len:175 (+) Transcript_93789:1237-1761(+)